MTPLHESLCYFMTMIAGAGFIPKRKKQEGVLPFNAQSSFLKIFSTAGGDEHVPTSFI
jgi:hypothetical protein